MSAQDTARGLTSGFFAIGASACVGFTCGAYVNSVQFQYLSGGTCSIVGISTMSQGALMFSSLPQNFGGPLSCFFNTLNGTTSIVQFIKVLNDPSIGF